MLYHIPVIDLNEFWDNLKKKRQDSALQEYLVSWRTKLLSPLWGKWIIFT